MFRFIRHLSHRMGEQVRCHGRLLLFAYAPPAIFMLILALQPVIPLHDLTADPATIANIPAYVGLVSNLGVVMWAAALAVCLFAALLLWQRSRWARFFAGSAGLTGVLLLDDQLMIHDRVLPWFGIPEPVYVVFYGLASLVYTLVFWRFLRQTDFTLLLIAIALFGGSIVIDVAGPHVQRVYHILRGTEVMEDHAQVTTLTWFPAGLGTDGTHAISLSHTTGSAAGGRLLPDGNLGQLAEEAPKLLGITGWLLYFALVARGRLMREMRDSANHPVE